MNPIGHSGGIAAGHIVGAQFDLCGFKLASCTLEHCIVAGDAESYIDNCRLVECDLTGYHGAISTTTFVKCAGRDGEWDGPVMLMMPTTNESPRLTP